MSVESDFSTGSSQDLRAAVLDWIEGYEPSVVEVVELPVPEDDDYGLEVVLALRPARTNSCPIEVGITLPEAGSATYVSLDLWQQIATREGLGISDGSRELAGLYIEPIKMDRDTLLKLCHGVADGKIYLEISIWAGRLLGTRGSLPLDSGTFPMRGTAFVPFWTAKLGAKLGAAETRVIEYAPWT